MRPLMTITVVVPHDEMGAVLGDLEPIGDDLGTGKTPTASSMSARSRLCSATPLSFGR